MTAQALPGAGRQGGAMSAAPEAQCLPPQGQTSDLASSTPAKSRSRWQRGRLVALRPVLASWTCLSLSDSAGLPVVSSGMNLLGGAGKLGERGFAKLLAGLRRRPLLFSLPWVLYSSVAPPGYLPALQARTGVPW